MAQIVGFISQKGGVGKSTLARGLSREAAKGGLNVKLADLDTQQGTSVDWYRRRLDSGALPVFSVESFKTASQALRSADQLDMLLLDGPARASSATLEIAQAATLVVQPSGASVDDLRPAILVFHELVKAGIPKDRLCFALCRIGTDAEEADSRSYIEQAGYMTLQGSLPERPSYRQASNAGLSITETRYPQLNLRADTLIQSMVDKLNG
ncbi:chromosome partitioning protein [Granulicella aggregans]|uniref:Chromosome partitioning protein n=1 Tax=Granulicella aggregans TaxID=474949 RepID=A0A7W7ZKD3_9BACT|nr:ParA family protein [Granulicella aggregans]MBB5061199.1 chromosome partitioning protein [Granulicella aggregans]